MENLSHSGQTPLARLASKGSNKQYIPKQGHGAYIVFHTNTVLDFRAVNTFGLTAKPNSKSPIGYFGTGLKMAIAVLLRNKIPVRLFIGDTEYEFIQALGRFRDQEYVQLGYRKKQGLLKNFSYHDLPFTTELAKNWDVWQAFRELESNTRDEGGVTSIQYTADESSFIGKAGVTRFVIGPSDEFEKVYEERDKIFLPEALQTFEWGDKRLQIFREPSNCIYYRGIRIYDLSKPSIFTYNILSPIDLTEDRTAKYTWELEDLVVGFLAVSEDKGLINHLLNATPNHWESSLAWDAPANIYPSAVFKDILARRTASEAGKALRMSPRFTTMHENHTPKPVEPVDETQFLWHQLQEFQKDCSPQFTTPINDMLQACIDALKENDL